MPGSEGQRTWGVQASMRGSCAVERLERTVLMAPLARRVRGKPRRPKGRDATDMASSGLLVARLVWAEGSDLNAHGVVSGLSSELERSQDVGHAQGVAHCVGVGAGSVLFVA